MMLHYAAMFLTGMLAKLTDNLEDSPKKQKTRLSLATGTAYGITAAILITASQQLAILITAITAAMLLAGKIDTRPHQAAAAIILAAAAFSRIAYASLPLLAFFAALSIIDELSNDYTDKAKKTGKQTLPQKIMQKRLLLEAGTLAHGIMAGNLAYFLALISFDLAYNLTEKAMKKQESKQPN